MKANEFRIGNIIGWRLGTGDLVVGHVFAIEEDKVAISKKTPSINDEGEESIGQGFMLLGGVEPIPLTEEWLLNFGFEIKHFNGINPSSARHKRILKDDIARFDLTNSAGNWWFSEVYGKCFGFMEIKYVHQLQNLYFALTGEELILK